MFLGSRQRILATIQDIISTAEHRQDHVRVAVAFWGDGSELIFGQNGNYEMICNLEHPGTNPYAIERILLKHNVTMKQNSSLHAKVVIGSAGAFVGSSNLSERALGIQRSDLDGWIEAGVFLDAHSADLTEAHLWFESTWGGSVGISSEDISRAKLNWDARAQSIASEALEEEQEPLPDNEQASEEPELLDGEIFEPENLSKNPGNKTRMASRKLSGLYYQAFPDQKRDGSTIKVPAHAANLLWTLSGKEMWTKIGGTPAFLTPEMVVERAKKLGTYARVNEFMAKLAHDQNLHPGAAIRYWAAKYDPEG